LKDIIDGNISKCFIEMSACAGSCIGGPTMNEQHRAVIRDVVAVNRYAKKEDFLVEKLDLDILKQEMPFLGLHRTMPGSMAVTEVLRQMGKHNPEDELNCGSCGYNTCREKAVAVIQGKADLTMCLPYLKEKAESFSDTIIKNTPNGIIVLNEDLEVQQINAAAKKIMNIKYSNDVLGNPVIRILDPCSFIDVLGTGKNIHNKRVYLAEYDKFVEESIIYDKAYHIIMAIMRDITEEEKECSRKENVSKNAVDITDKVIEKQMRIVQEIASLLGETTAETKIALTNLKETLTNE
ncbi:MAG: histidine kinase, partial [Clostridiales bacterium]|nr:histidine kinase [Clostridiales bacterium]